MASSIDQYSPVFLPGAPPWQRNLAGQSTGSQRVGHDRRDPVHIDGRLFSSGSSAPVRIIMKVAQLLGLQGLSWLQVCRDMDCCHCRNYSPIKVFSWASCSWRSEGLFGQSFSVTPPIQALRGLPCLGPFSVVQFIRYREGPPWLGSWSVDGRISHLKEHPGWGPTL